MLLTIVTVNYNNKLGLEATINSVINQNCNDFEWIIIDAASTDGSVQLLERHKNHFDYWGSEPDKGVYDGMNKGVKLATGDYILFLNSGDILCANTIIDLVKARNPKDDLIICDYFKITDEERIRVNQSDKIPREFLIEGMFCHQSILHKRTLFERIGYYDIGYKIVADYVFLLKAFFQCNATFSYLDSPIVVYDDREGISHYNANSEVQYLKERSEALKEIFPVELVNVLDQKKEQIAYLNQINAIYEGWKQSGIIKLALALTNIKQKLTKR